MVTDSIDSLLYSSLTNYYYRLSLEGYCEYKKVYKLLFLIFLNRILQGYYGFSVEENDFNKLMEYMYKVTGTCLTGPLVENTKDGIYTPSSLFIKLRESDSSTLRVSEEATLRKVM